MLRLFSPRVCARPLCDPQPVFQATRKYADYRWRRVFFGIYDSHHLNGDDFIGKAARRAPHLRNIRDEMPRGDILVDHEGVCTIRLKPKNPGKVALLGLLPGQHTVFPLSASSRSLLPPSAAINILHVPPRYVGPTEEEKILLAKLRSTFSPDVVKNILTGA